MDLLTPRLRQLNLRLSDDELEVLSAAAHRERERLATWARRMLLELARRRLARGQPSR